MRRTLVLKRLHFILQPLLSRESKQLLGRSCKGAEVSSSPMWLCLWLIASIRLFCAWALASWLLLTEGQANVTMPCGGVSRESMCIAAELGQIPTPPPAQALHVMTQLGSMVNDGRRLISVLWVLCTMHLSTKRVPLKGAGTPVQGHSCTPPLSSLSCKSLPAWGIRG